MKLSALASSKRIARPAHAEGDVAIGKPMALSDGGVLGEMDIGDVGYPDLVRRGRHQAAHLIRDGEKARWPFRRRFQERRLALREPLLLLFEDAKLRALQAAFRNADTELCGCQSKEVGKPHTCAGRASRDNA